MTKQIKITYLKKADKFLLKHKHIITESEVDLLMIKAIKKKIYNLDINLDMKNLKGSLSDKYRVRKGTIRVIFELKNSEIIIESIVEDIDFRGNIY